ncbi:MAG: enoyl-CoA hydratase/isomerase family protein [Parvibaculum sp.]|uniref:enoyl-CoA hydratase-related protein n=1 Tax=Parvibaculum sp. TaxID=2024848 RepID=UPI0025D654E5|nr:enoyl-CoA hydratase-related protein [Parvibaculum sp.]MCE9650288.1 enoyl-CoA hydratase/isomerase family protein [Parvibaculum sp.]
MSEISYDVKDAAAIIRFERPDKLNAFTYPMLNDFRAAVKRAEADPDVFGIVITGAGRAFSAGLDTGALTATAAQGSSSGRNVQRDEDELPALFSYLLQIEKPVIAAVNGVAAGGGFVLAMMCDLRFCAEEASFTTAFSRRGLVAEHGTSYLLPRLVGTSRALDLLWSARRIDAAEAMRIGFADRVVPGSLLMEMTLGYLADLAANVSPHSVAQMKAAVYRHLSLPLADAFRDADRLTYAALDHPDAKEGVASFVERRPPRFARPTGKK